jgi:hypothetical protein
VREQSATRKELEQSIRALLPKELLTMRDVNPSQSASTAAAGVGGLFAGYVWGWVRGRRRRSKRTRS